MDKIKSILDIINNYSLEEDLSNKNLDKDERTIDTHINSSFLNYSEQYHVSDDKYTVQLQKINRIRFDDQFRTLEQSFPFKTMRSAQQIILNKLKLCDNKKYIIIEAPVGAGKSAIAHTVAFHFNNAYILVATKLLQDQYNQEFNNIAVIKGKGNYMCKYKKIQCNLADCIYNPAISAKCKESNCCPFITAKQQASESSVTVTSYAYFFTWLNNSSTDFYPRKVLICDEAHLFAQHIINWATITLNLKELDNKYHILENEYVDNLLLLKANLNDRLCSLHTIKNYVAEDGFTDNNKNYIYSVYLLLKYKLSLLNKIFALINGTTSKQQKLYKHILAESSWGLEKKDIDKSIQSVDYILYQLLNGNNININLPSRTASWYKKRQIQIFSIKENLSILINTIDNFFEDIKTNINNWVIYLNQDTLNIKPLYANEIFNKFIADYGIEHIVFMSATILNPQLFCYELGINKSDVNYIKVDSDFDPKKSPIYYYPIGDMSYKVFQNAEKSNKLIYNLIKTIMLILKKYPDKKGIIHTGNYNIASIIINNINNARLLMKRKNESNEQLLKRHIKMNNGVLVSPSLGTGTDLKDDLSRFQIIVKLPFISLGDKAIKMRAKLNSDWYVCDMLKNLIQSCGRSTRSMDDYSDTYILDSSFHKWIKNYKSWLPESFLQRIIWPEENLI